MYISSEAHAPGPAGFPAHVTTTLIGVLLSSGLSLCNYALETNFLRKYPRVTAIKPDFASKYKHLPASVKLGNAPRLSIKIIGPAATRSIPPLASKTMNGTCLSTPLSGYTFGLLLAIAILAFIAILVATFRIEPNLRRNRPVDSDPSRNSSSSRFRSNGYSFFVPVPDYRATTSRRPGGSGGGGQNPRAPTQNAPGSRSAPIKIESTEPPQLTFSECGGSPPPPPPPGPPSPPETVPMPDANDDATPNSSNEFRYVLPGFILGFLTGMVAQHLAEKRKYRKLVTLVLEDLHRPAIMFAPASSPAHTGRPRPEPTPTDSDCANIIPLTARPRTATATPPSQSVKLDSVEENKLEPDVLSSAKLNSNIVLVSAVALYLITVFLVVRYTWQYYQRTKFLEYEPRARNLNLDGESTSEALIDDKSGRSDVDQDIADCAMVAGDLVESDTTTNDSEVITPTDIATALPDTTPTQATMTAPQWKYQKRAINHNRGAVIRVPYAPAVTKPRFLLQAGPVLDRKVPLSSDIVPSSTSAPKSIVGAPTISGAPGVLPLSIVSQTVPTAVRETSTPPKATFSQENSPPIKDKEIARSTENDSISASRTEDSLKSLSTAVHLKTNPIVNSGLSASRWAPKVQGSLSTDSESSRNQQGTASGNAQTPANTSSSRKKFQLKANNYNREPVLGHGAPKPSDSIPSNESLPTSTPEAPPISLPSVILPLASVSQPDPIPAREEPISSDDEMPPIRIDKGKRRAMDNDFASAAGTEYGFGHFGHSALPKASPITSGLSESRWAPTAQSFSSAASNSSRNQHGTKRKSSSTTPPSPRKLRLHDNGTSASLWAPKPEERSSSTDSNSLHNQQDADSKSSTRSTTPPSSSRVLKDDGGTGSSMWARIPDDGPLSGDSSLKNQRVGGRNTDGRNGNPSGSPYARPPRGSSGHPRSARNRREATSGTTSADTNRTSPSSDETPKVPSVNHIKTQHSSTQTGGSAIASSGISTSLTRDTSVVSGIAQPGGRDATGTLEDFQILFSKHYNTTAPQETSVPNPNQHPNISATINSIMPPSTATSSSSLNPAAPSFQPRLHIVTGQDATPQHSSSPDTTPDVADSTTAPSSPIRDPYSVFSYLDLHRSDSESDPSALSSSSRRETRPSRTRSCNDIDSVDYDLPEDEEPTDDHPEDTLDTALSTADRNLPSLDPPSPETIAS